MLLDRLSRNSSYRLGEYAFARGEVILRRSIVDGRADSESGFNEWSTIDWIYVQCEGCEATSTSHDDYSGLLKRMLNALTACENLTSSEDQSSSSKVPVLDGDNEDGEEMELRNVPANLLPENPALYSPWIDVSTMSLSNMVLASIWLESCMRKHRVCAEFQKRSHLPSRIIDISNPQKPILAEGLNRNEPYLTLSYKWGEARRYVTTTANLMRHARLEIPLYELPRTFKDAIFVAGFLGFRWIWIDALCICQDSPDELLQEIKKMDQTFQNSALTIFAAAGDSADSGLMSTRDPRWVKPCKLTIKTTLDGKTAEGSVYITLDRGERTSSPLYDRGWVLQEQVLAHRGLIFESRQLRWRCLCGSASEAFPARTSMQTFHNVRDIGLPQHDRWISYPKGHDGFNHLRMWIQRKDPMPDRTPWQRDNQYDAWYAMVTQYNTRALSYEKDVLNALAGLASSMANTHSCTYFAGLWKEDLQTGLCWFITDIDHATADSQLNSTESLPSWTWVSRRGSEIQFRGWENNHTVVEHEGLSCIEHCTNGYPHSDNPFTTVTPKELWVTGRVRKIAVEKLSKRDDDWQDSSRKHHGDLSAARWVWRVRDIKTIEKLGHIAFDFDPAGFETRYIYCLLCIAREKYGEWQLTCLGLVPTDETLEEFKRVGLIMLRQQDWFGKLQEYYLDAEYTSSLVRRSGKDMRFTKTI